MVNLKAEIQKTAVQNKGTMIYECGEEFEQYIKRFLTLVDKINAAWQGADATKYVNALKNVYANDLNELSNNIKTFGTYLKSIPGAYEQLDEIFASKFIDV